MNFTQFLASLGGNPQAQRVSRWKTSVYTATAADAAFGLTNGVTYTIWVAQSNFQTKSGSQVTQGEWFAVAKA